VTTTIVADSRPQGPVTVHATPAQGRNPSEKSDDMTFQT